MFFDNAVCFKNFGIKLKIICASFKSNLFVEKNIYILKVRKLVPLMISMHFLLVLKLVLKDEVNISLNKVANMEF